MESDSVVMVDFILDRCSHQHPCLITVVFISCLKMHSWQINFKHGYR